MEPGEREGWIEYLLGLNAHSLSRSAWQLKQPPTYAPLTAEAKVRLADIGIKTERAAEQQRLTMLPDTELELRGLKAFVSEQQVRLMSARDQIEQLERTCSELDETKARIARLENELAVTLDTAAHRWPWGSYETELLRQLAAAVERYWVRYVTADPSTASKSEDVTAWLMEQSINGKPIARRVAEVIAQTIRADGLPTGPR